MDCFPNKYNNKISIIKVMRDTFILNRPTSVILDDNDYLLQISIIIEFMRCRYSFYSAFWNCYQNYQISLFFFCRWRWSLFWCSQWTATNVSCKKTSTFLQHIMEALQRKRKEKKIWTNVPHCEYVLVRNSCMNFCQKSFKRTQESINTWWIQHNGIFKRSFFCLSSDSHNNVKQ